jgi:flavin reductase (DIM6/NTAB) family NADH-FMN oxidoreductase RutF
VRASQENDVVGDWAGKKDQARVFREVMSHYASGVTVVSTFDGVEPVGFTCQSFFSVSMEPQLVSLCVMKTSTTFPRVRRAGRFAVSMLSYDQGWVSDQFARSGAGKWAGVAWSTSPGRNPWIDGALAWLDCEMRAEYDAGDHAIVVGMVTALTRNDAGQDDPLLYFRGRYCALREGNRQPS